ncbi:MAG: glycosyltransferase family 2 protein [Alphaproteobacteria bacterium]|nr:MAG: glycosyltransferase family 2 protein [Alphaproteobacteria bacterium]
MSLPGVIRPSSETFIGVVTVLYNSDDVLPDFFASLAAQERVRYRLYVIDNSAADSGLVISRDLASRYGVDAIFIFNNANVGVAKGNNQGIEMALNDGCTHILLANNDTAFAPSTIASLVETLRDSGDAAATPKIMYHGEPERIWYGGGHINPWSMRTPHYGDMQLDRGQFDHLQYVGYAPTCFMLIRRDVFSRVGMMDEDYFVYYDDTDFVWRFNQLGLRIRYVPQSVVLHKVSTSTGGGLSPFSLYYTNRNRVYFIRKNLKGVQRVAAMTYMLATRIPRLLFLPRKLSERAWAGVRDGFRMNASKPA